MVRAYQLRVALEDIRPEIWRRVVVPGDLTLEELHGVFQDAMGWRRGHLHEFLARGLRIGMEEERLWTLERLCEGRETFQYLYDFGDDWMHEVRIEEVGEVDGSFAPRCIGGERACPPEGCGGVCEYLHMIDALAPAAVD